MIIVQLTGGLGNQLFQYAMGRSLALRSGSTLKTDISFFENYEWHDYSLAPFNLNATIATLEECNAITKMQPGFINRIINKFTGKLSGSITEDSLAYNGRYKRISPPAYLMGYWQCEKYFDKYADTIRKDLEITVPPSEANRLMLSRIINGNAISLHIRRGNYVNVASVNSVHGTCSMEYYIHAIAYLEKQVTDPVFYIFSDDIAWAKENLVTNNDLVFIDINDAQNDFEDLRLMQHCKHHIIANSTFSWWGAWLNNKPGKIVVAPKRWFADEEKNKTASAIIPENWTRF